MPTEFYFEIQYFNFHWKCTLSFLHNHRNTQQWQVSVIQSQNQQQSIVRIQQFFNIVHSLNVLQQM